MRFKRIGAAVAIAALASSVSLLTQGSTGQDTADQAKLIRHERTLESGRTKVVQFVNSATGKAEYTAAVDPRDEVYLVETGEEGLYEMGVEPYQPTTEAEMDALARKLTPQVAAERRSAVELPAQAATEAEERVPTGAVNRAAPLGAMPSMDISGDGKVFALSCLRIENNQLYAKSCYERRRVPESMDNWYLIADSSEMWGHHNGYYGALRMLKSRHDYDAGDTGTMVVKFRPIGPIEKDCTTVNIGITWDAFNLSAPVRACPTKLDSFDGDRDTYFHHAWYGNEPTDTDERYTTGHSIVKGHVNRSVGFDFRIAAREFDACCGTDEWSAG